MKIFRVGLIIILSLLLLCAAGLCISHQVFIPNPQEYSHTITVMTYNTHCMGWTQPKQRQQMLAFIREQNADIVCLQEVNLYRKTPLMSMNELKTAMSEYAYTYFDFKVYDGGKQFGNVVFSRYPLTNKQTISYPSRSNISSRCHTIIGKDTICLIINHLESFRFNPSDLSVDSLTSQPIRQTSLHRKLSEGARLRRIQAAAVRKEIRSSSYPCIVVGDFNSVPTSYVYLKIRGWMHDAFLCTGRGQWGATFRLHGIRVRIDYVLCSRSITPLDCRIPESTYSDHLPVVATLAW